MLTLRPIAPSDNPEVARLIRTVMPEFGCVGEGFSINDPEVDDMYGGYQGERSAFFVVEDSFAAGVDEAATRDPATPFGKTILAVAGYAPLTGGDADTCELRKMYALPAARGRGAGKLLLEACLQGAQRAGFTHMYLETVEAMTDAARLYQRFDFAPIDGPLGGTGHSGCNRFMMRAL